MLSRWGEHVMPERRRVRHDTNSVCRGKTHRRIRLRYLSPDRVENRAGAIRSGLSTRQFNPDVGQPETLGDSPLGRYGAIRGDAAVMHAHAAVHKDGVEIGLSVIQLEYRLTVLALVGRGAILDCRHGGFRRPLNLPDVVEKLGRGFWRRLTKNTSKAPPMSAAKAAKAADVTISSSQNGERPGIRKSSRRLPLRRSRAISTTRSSPSRTFAPWQRGMMPIWQNCRTFL